MGGGGGCLIWKMQGDVNMCKFVISMLTLPPWQYSKQTAGRRGNICRLQRRARRSLPLIFSFLGECTALPLSFIPPPPSALPSVRPSFSIIDTFKSESLCARGYENGSLSVFQTAVHKHGIRWRNAFVRTRCLHIKTDRVVVKSPIWSFESPL